MSEPVLQSPRSLRIVAIFSCIFGVVSLIAGGSVLFVDGAVREALGSYVTFVVWFNFGSGIFYLAAGMGLWARKVWVYCLSLLFSILTLIVLLLFTLTVFTGVDYEPRTFFAMIFRLSLWVAIAAFAYKAIYRFSARKIWR